MTDQPTNEIAVVRASRDTDSWTDVAGDVIKLSDHIARTQFVPKQLQGNPAGVAAAILTGRELDLGPMASLRGIQIIEGKPSLTAEMMAAKILAGGHAIHWVNSTDQECTVKIVRRDGLSEAEVRYTMKDAQRAGLAGKGNWAKDPRSMLRWRALSNAARMACPDVILGLDVGDVAPDQATGAEPSTWTAVQVNTPEPEPVEEPTPEALPAGSDNPETVTQAQLRKLNAQLGELQKLHGEKWDKDHRRGVILQAAGLTPDAVESATELTKTQASQAIERLDELISVGLAPDPSEEVIDAEVMDIPEGEQ